MEACCALHPEAAELPVHSHQDHRHHHYHQVLHHHHHRRSPSAPPALLAVYDGGGDDVGAYADISPSAAGPRREASEAALEARLAAVEARLEAKAASADAAGGGDATPLGHGYTFRVQTMLLYDATSPTLLLHLGACVAVKMLQLVALQAVWQTIFFPMDFQRKVAVDDAFDDGYPAFRGGMPFPVDYQSLFSSQNHNGGVGVDGVNWVVLFVLVFCCFCATLATVPELDSVKAGFLLLAERAHACLVDRSKLTGDVACRLAACFLVHLLRVTLFWYYLDIQAQLFGTTDGPLDLLLNSLALGFVLEVDDVITYDGPSSNLFGLDLSERHRAEASERGARVRATLAAAAAHVRGAGARVRGAYFAIPTACTLAVGSATFLISFKMQRYTTNGDFVTIDDDSPLGKKHPQLTHLYNWMLYVALAAIVVNIHSVAFIVAESYDRAKHRRAEIAVAVGRALFDFHFCALFRVCVVQYLIGRLFMFNQSTTTFPLDFWNTLNPAPDRADEPDE